MPRGIQDSSKRDFVKKGKIHQAQKGRSASRQERSLESASKGPKSIKLRRIRREKCPQKFISPKKKKKKEKKIKPARLKTQKGSLGKSQGQRKEEEKKKIGKSYQVGNLKMQPKKRTILQDESLEV